MEHILEVLAGEIADKTAGYSKNVRDTVKVARLYKGQQSMAVDRVTKLVSEIKYFRPTLF